MGGWVDIQMDGRMDRRTGGWMDPEEYHIEIKTEEHGGKVCGKRDKDKIRLVERQRGRNKLNTEIQNGANMKEVNRTNVCTCGGEGVGEETERPRRHCR